MPASSVLVFLPIDQLRRAQRVGAPRARRAADDARRLDTAVLVPRAPGPVIAAPSPAREAPSAEAAVALCARVACRAVIASGVDMDARAAHDVARAALRGPAFEVRVDPSLARGRTLFHVATEAPDVNVSALWPSGMELSWRGAAGRASVLRANPQDLWRVIGAPAISTVPSMSLEAWYARQFTTVTQVLGEEPAVQLTGAAPSHSEIRFLEIVVARAALAGDLERAHAMARLVGYEITILADGLGPGTAVWTLAEPNPKRLGWGALVGRVGDTAALTIESPRPRRESGTGRLAVELFRHANASR